MNQEDSLVQYLNPAVRAYLVNLVGEQDLQDLHYVYLELGYTPQELAPHQANMMAFTKQELGRLAHEHTPTARVRLVRMCETLVQFYLLNQGGDAQQALAKINAFFPAGLRFSPHSGRLLFFPEQFSVNRELLEEANYALVNQMTGGNLVVAYPPAPDFQSAHSPEPAEDTTDNGLTEAYDEAAEEESDEATPEAYDEAAEGESNEATAEAYDEAAEEESNEATPEAYDEAAEGESDEATPEAYDEAAEEESNEATPEAYDNTPSLDDVLSELGPPEPEPPPFAQLHDSLEAVMPESSHFEPESVVEPETKSAMDALAEVKNRRLKLLKKLQQTGS